MISLIFPPAASPTYIPLGVSALKSYVDRQCGTGLIHIEDLNIRYWEYLCSQKIEYQEYQSFVKGQSGFFNRGFYEPHIPASRALKDESANLLHDIRIYLDRRVLGEALEKLFHFLRSSLEVSCEVVMFSCLFPDQYLFTLGFSRWLSGIQTCRIYIGGASSLLVDPQTLLESASWIEGVFTGEGEAALEVFLSQGEDSPIPGMYRRREEQIVQDAPQLIISMDTLPAPDFSWAPLSSYFNPKTVLPIQLSRGCKWRRCRFCAHNFSFGTYRCSEVISAVDMIARNVVDYNARPFYFPDQYLDGAFLEPFAKEILSRNLKINYTFMGRPAEDMTSEILELLALSGCSWISWGVESGSSRLLSVAGKGTHPETVARVLRASKEAGINNQALMIFGLPESDDQALEETLEFLQVNRDSIDSTTASEFQLYLGTPFGKHPERYRIKITGTEAFCSIDGRSLASVKVKHTDLAWGEEAEVLRGPLEAKRWRRRKVWIYPDTFWDSLPSEHYLILKRPGNSIENPDNPEFWDNAV